MRCSRETVSAKSLFGEINIRVGQCPCSVLPIARETPSGVKIAQHLGHSAEQPNLIILCLQNVA